MQLKVLISTNIPSPYFVDYANELTKYVDLTVLFELKSAADRDKSWKNNEENFVFKYQYLKAIPFNKESGLSFKLIKYIKNNKFDRIIIANPLTPTGIITIRWLSKHNIPFIIQSEGGIKKDGRGIKERIKYNILSKAQYYLTGMGGKDDYFMQYGATLDKLKKYYFTSLREKDILDLPINKEEKNRIKRYLNISFENLVLYVGQFIERKNIPALLKSASKTRSNTGFVLIGGNPHKKYKKIINKLKLKNIIFLPFMNKELLKKYYMASDIFVLPTKEDTWGLVINEAMANGLPVITTNKSIAANILIKNDVNGFFVDPEDELSISNRITQLIENKNLYKKIVNNNLKTIRQYTIENMASTIYNYLKD